MKHLKNSASAASLKSTQSKKSTNGPQKKMPSLGYKSDELLNMTNFVNVAQRVNYQQMQF